MEQCEWCGNEITDLNNARVLQLDQFKLRVCTKCSADHWHTLVRVLNEMRDINRGFRWNVRSMFQVNYHWPSKWSWEE